MGYYDQHILSLQEEKITTLCERVTQLEEDKKKPIIQLVDPDGNVIEVTGEYTPKEGEFNE